MFINTNTPTCFGPFYSTILRGPYAVLRAVTISLPLIFLRKSAEDTIVTAQSTAYGPLRMVE